MACGAGDGASDLSIGGGVAADENIYSIVRVANNDQAICTGVLVARDLVITAAHCLKSDETSAYSVIFPLASVGKTIGAAEFKRVREDSLQYFPNFDLAWIRLSSPAPQSYVPATLLGDTAKVEPGTSLSLVGAANNTACNSADPLCSLVKLGVSLKRNWSSPHLINLAVVESDNTGNSSGTCPGDSGGPAFVKEGSSHLLFGIVAGKDPIFTSNSLPPCGSPTTVLTRIGEYQSWIETTSGRKLNVVRPSIKPLSESFLSSSNNSTAVYSSWEDWFSKPRPGDSAWIAVHKLLEQTVLTFQGKIPQAEIPLLFENGGLKWLEQITVLKGLTLGFPDQAVVVDDLRPLEVLKNLSELTFIARSYKGMDVLERLPNLSTLSIFGRVPVQIQQGKFNWSQLASPYISTLKLNQIPASDFSLIDGSKLPGLKSFSVASPLGRVLSSQVLAKNLTQLETLQVQEFTCDQATWPKVSLPKLKSLSLRSTSSPRQNQIACINWELLPNLSEVNLQGYHIDVSRTGSGISKLVSEQLR